MRLMAAEKFVTVLMAAWTSSLVNNPLLSIHLGLRSMRPRQACPVAAATTALTRSSAGGPNMARPRRDTPTVAVTVGAAATDPASDPPFMMMMVKSQQRFVAVCESLSCLLRCLNGCRWTDGEIPGYRYWCRIMDWDLRVSFSCIPATQAVCSVSFHT